jgi:hypothetical protein
MKSIYICLSNARFMPKPGRQMFSNVPHGVLVYSPEAKYIVIGPKNKRVYRYYPPEMFCACTFDPVFENGSAFANKWQPLRTAASAFWPVSHEWKAISRDVTKSLKNLRFLPVCIVRPFSGVFLQYIPIA